MSDSAKWYVIHTYSGYENAVKSSIEKFVAGRGMEDMILRMEIPMETVTEVTDSGASKEVERKVFPGYVLIKMVMTDASWHAVRNITGVTGFVGPGSRPTPLSEEEVERLNIEEVKVRLSFRVGDTVQIVSGLFEGYTGVVQSISEDMRTVTVLVKRGRRDVPVEMETSLVRPAQ